MTRWVRTLALGFLAALTAAAPPATAPCGPAGACALRVTAVRIAAGRDDVTQERLQQSKAADWYLAKGEQDGAGGGSTHFSTNTLFAGGEGQGMRRLLEKEQEMFDGGKTPLKESNSGLLRLLPVKATVSAPPAQQTLTRVPRALSNDEKTALSKKLIDAAKYGNLVEMGSLLGRGADVHYRDDDRRTALHWAAWICDVDEVRLLIEAGAPINARNVHLYAPMNFAAWNGCEACIDALAAAGANVDARNKDGWTPLHEAANYNMEKGIRALLKVGADPSIKNHGGKTARHYTTSNAIRALLPMFE